MNLQLPFSLMSLQNMGGFSFVAVLLMLCLSNAEGLATPKHWDLSPCPNLDKCQYRSSLNSTSKEFTCACDESCSQYDDCCLDAPRYGTEGNAFDVKCVEINHLGGVYMKDSCSPAYRGPASIRHKCEETEFGHPADPLASMPVTDALTGVTYKNYYCGKCNGKSDNMIMWTPKIEFPLLSVFNASKKITNDYVLQKLTTDGQSWGLYLDDEDDSSRFFHDCEVSPTVPEQLTNKVRLCKPHLVSDCPTSWENEEVQERCKSYSGARFVRGSDEGYKNVHCAICNGITESQLSCSSSEQEQFGNDFFRFSGTHNFAMLLDVSEAQGEIVGKIKMCKTGDVYDPFFKKCRNLLCLPGFVRRGRKCVPNRKFVRKEPRVSAKNQQRIVATNQPSTPVHVTSTEASRLKTVSDSSSRSHSTMPVYTTSTESSTTAKGVMTEKIENATSQSEMSSTGDNLFEVTSVVPFETEGDSLSSKQELSSTSLPTTENVTYPTTGTIAVSTPEPTSTLKSSSDVPVSREVKDFSNEFSELRPMFY